MSELKKVKPESAVKLKSIIIKLKLTAELELIAKPESTVELKSIVKPE